jgi:ubiquinone biosynthesis protein UbiJ
VITDSAAVRDADVVRLRRHVDDLAARVSRLEPRARLVDAR